MARSPSFRLLKLKNYLNTYYSYADSRSSVLEIPVRYLRGSRFSKDHNQEELKFQKLLRTLKCGSKPYDPKVSAAEAVATELQKDATELQKDVAEDSSRIDSDKEFARVTSDDIIRRLQEKMVPLKEVPYKKQLAKKLMKSRTILRILGRKLEYLNVPIAMSSDKLPCPLDIVVPSPVLEAYRNRDDFNIGLGLDGSEKTVGFFLDPPGEFSSTFCISPKDLVILKDSHKKIAEDFQSYIRESPLPASKHYTDKGYWKNLIVRSNAAGDIMGTVVMHPQELSQDELQVEKEKLKDYFSTIPADRYNLHSLYFQACKHSRCTHEQSPFELILGEPFIVEEANHLELHISPDSFFHHNTKAAETMFDALLKLCRVNKSTTVLDICCGIGPVSLLFSPKVKNCIGIDDSMQSIIDAKLNALENRRKNVEFVYGQPDVVMKEVLDSHFHEDLLVILNNSRCTINRPLISCLREFKNVDKIVYISNKPHVAVDNYIHLCKPCGPARNLGKAFLPILALPYDISPHTEQFGLIVMFQRL